MAHRQPFSPFFQDSLKLISYCPLCESQYNPMEAKIIEQREDAHLVHVQCRRCRSSIIVLIAAHPSGVSSVGMITDLTAEDVARFRAAEQVTCNDVLDIHEFLSQREQLFIEMVGGRDKRIENRE